MSPLVITILMFSSLLLLLAFGVPVAFTMGSVGVIFSLALWGPKALNILTGIVFTSTTDFIMVALPLFVFMAMVLEKSRIADNMYSMMHNMFGGLRGGLAMGTVVICAVMAAMTGLSATATLTMGLIALPAMLKRGYRKDIAIGCITAGGALGPLIPPSGMFIIFGALFDVSVGALFISGLFPGLLLAALFIIYIGIRCFFQKNLGPALPPEERPNWREKVVSLKSMALPIALILMVLGSIFFGIATPTEAAAVGAVGSIICAIVQRTFNWGVLKSACYSAVKLTAMVMWIMFGSKLFSSVYVALGAPSIIHESIVSFGVNSWTVLIGMQLTFFILGCILDPIAILLIAGPIFVPIARALGFDPVWYGCLFVMNMEIAYLTPPFGFNLFYMKSIVPKSITMGDVYRSVWPFVSLQALGLALVIIFPQIAMWLPTKMAG